MFGSVYRMGCLKKDGKKEIIRRPLQWSRTAVRGRAPQAWALAVKWKREDKCEGNGRLS